MTCILIVAAMRERVVVLKKIGNGLAQVGPFARRIPLFAQLLFQLNFCRVERR